MAEVRIKLEGEEEARRRLRDFERGLDEAQREADALERAARRRGSAASRGGSGGSLAKRVGIAAAATVIAGAVASAIGDAFARKLEDLGIPGLPKALEDLGADLGDLDGVLAQILRDLGRAG